MPIGNRKLDAFESMFRSAVKEVFHLSAPALTRITLVTDCSESQSQALLKRVQQFLDSIDESHTVSWTVVAGPDWDTIDDLLQRIEQLGPHLVVTYRLLRNADKTVRFSLGSAVDVLTQALPTPILLLPATDVFTENTDTSRVMVVTDHITGDDRLVNWGVHFTHKQGTLFLAHVEDETTLERILSATDKLPRIDSAAARTDIPAKLMQLPRDYIDTIQGVLNEHQIEETIVPIVQLGQSLDAYKSLLKEHSIALLILNGKDASQEAMSALTHALAVEIRNIPLLVL